MKPDPFSSPMKIKHSVLPFSQFSLRGIVFAISIAALFCAVAGYLLRSSESSLLIECDVPGTEVYAGPILLGKTPLSLSQRKFADLRLGNVPTGDTSTWFVPNGAGLVVNAPDKEGVLIWFRPPKDCDSNVSRQQTPWGDALFFEFGQFTGGKLQVKGIRRDANSRPIAASLKVPDAVSSRDYTFTSQLVLENEGAKNWEPTSQTVRIEVTMGTFSRADGSIHEMIYTPTFGEIAPGERKTVKIDLPVPNVPGVYRIRARLSPANNQVPFSAFLRLKWPTNTPCAVLRVEDAKRGEDNK